MRKYFQEVATNLKMKMYYTSLGNADSKSSFNLLLTKDTLEFLIRRINELINYANIRSFQNSIDSIITLQSIIY